MAQTARIELTIPEPCSVFGTVLRPFCLGHHLLLLRCGLPFAGNPQADCQPDELMLAVAICAAPFRDTLEAMLAGEWSEAIGRWMKRLRPGPFRRKPVFEIELAKFRCYLEAGYSFPPVWRHDSPSGIKLSAPWELVLKCRLVSAGFDEGDMMERYLPSAWYDYFAVTEMQQAANCTDAAKWRKVFFTPQDEEAVHGAEG